MGSRLGVVYSVVTVLFFIAIGVIFVLRLNAARDENIAVASTNLELIRKTSQVAFSESSIPRSRFRGAMNGIESETPSLLAVAVYSYSGGTYYVWARDNSYLTDSGPVTSGSAITNGNVTESSAEPTPNGAAAGIPEFQYNDLAATRITDSFDITSSQTYYVTGLYSVLGNEDVFPLLRDSLVLVLLFALGTLIITVLLMITGKVHDSAQSVEALAKEVARPVEPIRDEWERARPAHDDRLRDRHDGELHEGDTHEHGLRSHEAPATGPGEARPAVMPVQSPQAPQGPVGRDRKEPLERRLTLELERSAYNDQNLSIVLIRIPGMDAQPVVRKEIGSFVLSHYTFEDLIFESEADTFCVVMVNTELSGAIRSTEVFNERLRPALPAGLERPAYGLSSRNGRLIEANQLLKEARNACRRAEQAHGSRIIGFHSDPEKYREFLATQQPRRQ